jgi:hydrogenase maturation protein HypF
LDSFASQLEAEKPPLAIIEHIAHNPLPPAGNEIGFHILASHGEAYPTAQVTVDTVLCPDCLAEMLDSSDRRSRYGLINCTNCGPRYSIIRKVPYDRPNTTMAGFVMCGACRTEYTDPSDRRFHAQPIACHDCGPALQLVDSQGNRLADDPIKGAGQRLASGKILAIKGLGGFHLAVRADDWVAVLRLRQLKQRDFKPFALMCADMDRAHRLVELSEAAMEAMRSPATPIVLAPRRSEAEVAPAVAPGNHRLGVMLPYTPIHHLLFHAGRGQFDVLVMTSGNLSDEPLVIDNADAVRRLGSMCDAILLHDRPIERCVDDSVAIDVGDAPVLPIRRARGHVPAEIVLPRPAIEPGLALGGELKNTVAAVRDDRAILSQHMGDLNHPLAFASFKRAIADLCQLFSIEPKWIAHDLHPVYLSTAYARQLAETLGVPLIGVQHHHAHVAAVMAEHAISGPVIGIICDGTGYGPDGTIWGGELLLADLIGFKRLGRMRLMPLAGGDAAARDTRRCALGLLYQAYGAGLCEHAAAKRLVADPTERGMLCRMIQRGINCVMSSSTGRVFDGVAALLGLCFNNDFEAQAGMSVESAAYRAGAIGAGERLYELHDEPLLELDFAPLVRAIVERIERGWPSEELASLFHEQLAIAWSEAAGVASERTGVRTVALSGGVFCNQRLMERLTARLHERGMRVLRHRIVPPNDGGISLGQAVIGAARSASTDLRERQGV